ncbi:hypothetical protein [Paenibacillus sp. URB8-2]|uniref:hypothetical protein n=1 Tax=Paenibacillus sp. URB8-2 TaxID=2741301 RepID=UPI0015BA6788|nr:hypothetical protein [Paenibacillus sp. URB8-2]BCG57199.1 hypothetical protein PUR_06240 [Paenibacillus sp. URB8-2]
MSKRKTVWIPAILAVIFSLLLIAYSFYAQANGTHPQPSSGAGGLPPQGGRKEDLELFKWLGTMAVVCGAVSFSWVRFKKKLRSSSLPVQKLGKLLHRIHQFMGWTALALILVHGAYYLITRLQDDKIFTGLAAFLILLTLAGYGWLIKRVRNKWMRKAHFFLSLMWIPLLLLHAGGSAILTAVITAVVWVGVTFLERQAQPKAV